MDEQARRYVLLGRDGVINRHNWNGGGSCWDKYEFLPRALEALRLLAANQYAGIVISHQAYGRGGLQTTSPLDATTRRFLLEVTLSEGHIARVYYCRHRIEDGCNCYAPHAGLIARAKAEYGFRLAETFFVGESESELEAAAAAGCPCIQIQRDAFLQVRSQGEAPYRVTSSLYEAAEQIVGQGEVREHAYATVQM